MDTRAGDDPEEEEALAEEVAQVAAEDLVAEDLVAEHCFCPISGSIWIAQSNGECLKLTGFRIGVIDWYRVSNLVVSFHNFQASV